jgi:sugar/nucleoside kinase (ribokinase family)
MLPAKYAEIKSSCPDEDITDHIPLGMIRSLGSQIIDSGVKILLVKMAHRGAYLMTGDISSLNEKLDSKLSQKEWNHLELLCNAFHVDKLKFKNATAAGDTAIAAFLNAILNGEGPESALKYSALAGRNKLYCNSIYPELSDWQTMTGQMVSEPNAIVRL